MRTHRYMSFIILDAISATTFHLIPIFYWYISLVRRADVLTDRSNEAVIRILFQQMGGPTGDSAAGEDECEQFDGDAHGMVNGRGIKIDIAGDLFFVHHNGLDASGHIKPFHVTGFFTEFSG